MPQLIVIEKKVIGAEEVNSVNARDIHEELEVGTDFSHWIKRAIKKYDFLENVDYMTIVKKDGRQTLKEYIVTLEMAKELSMLENNAKGKETRKYFIAMEKKALSPYAGDLVPEMLVNFMHNIQTQNIEIQKQQNKILDAVVANSNAIVELASAINENARYTRMAAFETAMNVYSIDQTLNLKNIEDTLSKSMMDDLKKLITSVSKTLCMKHDISLADMQRLVYGKLNTKFGVSTYYKIEYLDFQKAMYFVHNMKLSGKTVESTFEPIINLD